MEERRSLITEKEIMALLRAQCEIQPDMLNLTRMEARTAVTIDCAALPKTRAHHWRSLTLSDCGFDEGLTVIGDSKAKYPLSLVVEECNTPQLIVEGSFDGILIEGRAIADLYLQTNRTKRIALRRNHFDRLYFQCDRLDEIFFEECDVKRLSCMMDWSGVCFDPTSIHCDQPLAFPLRVSRYAISFNTDFARFFRHLCPTTPLIFTSEARDLGKRRQFK
jgi:hypothetical protein